MALKQPIKTTTNTQAQPLATSKLQLPPPHVFDILPALHELLARVDAHNAQASSSHEVEEQAMLENDNTVLGSDYTDVQPLNPKDLPLATLNVKARIRSALKELEKLPDMDRTVQEQQEEMEELEVKIKKQREMLRGLADVASRMEEKIEVLGL